MNHTRRTFLGGVTVGLVVMTGTALASQNVNDLVIGGFGLAILSGAVTLAVAEPRVALRGLVIGVIGALPASLAIRFVTSGGTNVDEMVEMVAFWPLLLLLWAPFLLAVGSGFVAGQLLRAFLR